MEAVHVRPQPAAAARGHAGSDPAGLGQQDRIVPPVCGEQYARLLPDARLHLVEGGGHLLELEEPEALAALVAGHARAKPLAQSA
ncbi:MAG: hypothetical protein J4G09_14525 [Proteobacteria bacterium]|nr:hypothetical protein [Pseudomonadota bacterium]